MKIEKSIEYFNKEKTKIMWREIKIIFAEGNNIVYRELWNEACFKPLTVWANGNYFTYDEDGFLKKAGRGRIKKADLLKIEEMKIEAKKIISNMDF